MAQDRIFEYIPLWGSWQVDNLIGEGSYGSVYKVFREDMGRKYFAAVKIISVPSKEQLREAQNSLGRDEHALILYFDDVVKNIVNEVSVLYALSGNSNIVNYQDHQIIKRSGEIGWDILIRMEYLTSLRQYQDEKSLNTQDIVRMGIDICSALEVCSRQGLVHRDIKDENIFVNEFGIYKLGDFGIARELSKTGRAASARGTPLYMAPEVYRGEKYSELVDIYSLGMVLYKMFNHGRLPFMPSFPEVIRFRDSEDALERRLSGDLFPIPDQADDSLGEIIHKACAFYADQRYRSASEFKMYLTQYIEGLHESERYKPIINGKVKTITTVQPDANLTGGLAWKTDASSLKLHHTSSEFDDMNKTESLIGNDHVSSHISKEDDQVLESQSHSKPWKLFPSEGMEATSLIAHELDKTDSILDNLRNTDKGTLVEETNVNIGQSESDYEQVQPLSVPRYAKSYRKRNRNKLVVTILVTVGILFTSSVLVFAGVFKPLRYNNAISKMNGGDFPDAVQLFEQLNGYRDSASLLNESNYLYLKELVQQSLYDDALLVANEIVGYKDTDNLIIQIKSMINENHYLLGKQYLSDRNYELSINEFLLADGFADTSDQIRSAQYQYALVLKEDHQYPQAIEQLSKIPDYQDSMSQLRSTIYDYGWQLYAEADYYLAAKQFMEIYEYKDSKKYIVNSANQLAETNQSQYQEISNFILEHEINIPENNPTPSPIITPTLATSPTPNPTPTLTLKPTSTASSESISTQTSEPTPKPTSKPTPKPTTTPTPMPESTPKPHVIPTTEVTTVAPTTAPTTTGPSTNTTMETTVAPIETTETATPMTSAP